MQIIIIKVNVIEIKSKAKQKINKSKINHNNDCNEINEIILNDELIEC